MGAGFMGWESPTVEVARTVSARKPDLDWFPGNTMVNESGVVAVLAAID
jgi:hypothetical protein